MKYFPQVASAFASLMKGPRELPLRKRNLCIGGRAMSCKAIMGVTRSSEIAQQRAQLRCMGLSQEEFTARASSNLLAVRWHSAGVPGFCFETKSLPSALGMQAITDAP